LRRVAVVKLDCEGSEWPILLHSKELNRIGWLCGEYHAVRAHELCPEIPVPLSFKFLRRFLAQHFKYVLVVPDRVDSQLGKFWASNERPVLAE
jgi:hypothetical protein